MKNENLEIKIKKFKKITKKSKNKKEKNKKLQNITFLKLKTPTRLSEIAITWRFEYPKFDYPMVSLGTSEISNH